MSDLRTTPTVREIAEQCGVSEATVSRVLNGNYKNGFSVRPELRKKIIEVANSLGYRPNIAAKNLAKQKTRMVAILGSDVALGWPGNIYQPIVNSLVRIFHLCEYDVCITVPNLERYKTELPAWKVDGAIVLQECSCETIELMERIKLPYVVINGIAGPSGTSIIPDDVQATKQAIDYLVELGHKRIAYAGPTSEHKKHRSIEDRHNAYLSTLAEYGLEPIIGHDTIFQSVPAFLISAVLKNHATAILAYDHVEALKILHSAHILDIQIPRQVSLMCFNDVYLCNIVTPALTTIGMPTQQIGKMAADKLLQWIESPESYKPEVVKIAQDLRIRASTVPPLKK